MVTYTIKRILSSIPVLVGILIVTFLLARAIPGEPCKAILGEKATAEACEQFYKAKGLDKPVTVQLLIYFRDVLRLDLGDSIRFNRSVLTIISERLPVTIELAVAAFTLAVLVGVPAGVLAATRRNSIADVITMVGANVGVSMPVFWLGLMLAYFFALVLKDTPFWLPPSGRLDAAVSATPFYEVYGWEVVKDTGRYQFLEFFANLYIFNSIITADWEVLGNTIKHLILPAMALSTIPMAIIARMTRSSLLEVLGLDYIRTARAKGLRWYIVVMKHALRNAMLPVVTVMGLQLGGLLSGAVLTETVFGLAGLGRTLFESIQARDYPVIQGITLVAALIYVLANLAVDLSYAFLDPRIRVE